MGGAEQVLCSLIERLNSDEFEQQVIYFHDGPHVQTLKNLGVPVYKISGALCLYDPIFCWRLFRLLKKLQPDCLHTLLWSANFFGRVFARLLRIPCVSVVHNNVDQNGVVRNLLDTISFKGTSTLVAVSEQVKASLIDEHRWLPAAKVLVLPNGVDTAAIKKRGSTESVLRTTLGLSESHFVVGSVGRFEPVKNYGLLLEAFARVHQHHSHARLLLLGTGSQEKWLKERARELGIEDGVKFVIAQPAYGYYSLFDCFVQTSDKEGISMALLEAMSFSLPCVVTGIQGAHSVITHGRTGLVVPAGSAERVAHGVMKLVESASLRKELGAQAQRAVEDQFDSMQMVKRYDALFKGVFRIE